MLNKIRFLFLALACALCAAACSDASVIDEHPPVAGANTGIHPPVDTQGLVSHTAQAVLPTNCDAPPHLFKTLSNIVVTSAVGVPSCPLAWSQLNDVTSWWIGYTDAAHAPVSPWGKCQWNSTTWPYGGNRCRLHQDFSCPNGVWYTADVSAVGSVWSPWGVTQASLMATYNDGTCRRLATATF